MNVNCNRDPLTCRCEYHSGRVLGNPGADRIRAALHPEATDHEFDLGLNAAFGRPPILDFETYSREPLPFRKPIAPGVLLDDGPEPQPSRWRLAARWGGALAMVVAAASIMYAEGQRQPAPGAGFGIALGLLMGAALLLGGRRA